MKTLGFVYPCPTRVNPVFSRIPDMGAYTSEFDVFQPLFFTVRMDRIGSLEGSWFPDCISN